MSKQTIQDAWAAFEDSLKFETLDVFRKEGWRSCEDFQLVSVITRDALVHRLNNDKSLESKVVKVIEKGCVRKVKIYRPKQVSAARK